MLLTDDLGNAVRTPTDSVAEGFRPSSSGIGLKHQTPHTHKGVKLSSEVLQKLEALWADLPKFQALPQVPPRLMSYLYSSDEFGNTAIRPGALIDVAPLEPQVQGAKYQLSRYGLRYSLEQTFTYAGMSDVQQGNSNLGDYNLDFAAKWTVFDAPTAGTAGWISMQMEYQAPLGSSSQEQTVKSNVGTLTNPNGFWSSHEGFRLPELAWQQSFFAGQMVVLAGVVNQGNYIDANLYANSGRGQFLNSALINSMVLPLPAYGYGVNLQWQPSNDWYTLFGYSVGSSSPAYAPRTDFTWETWSLEWEVGYAPSDFLGLGPGIYRIQPFLGRSGEAVQGGLSFNLQQQLGPHSPFGWFGRFGFGGSQVAGGAKAEVGTGFVMQAPLKYAGWVPQLTNDLLGVGFVWSQPSTTTKTVYHINEYVFETFYTLQLSPTSQLQPDLQIVWNPAFNPDPGPAVVFQFQFLLKW
jgi:porin